MLCCSSNVISLPVGRESSQMSPWKPNLGVLSLGSYCLQYFQGGPLVYPQVLSPTPISVLQTPSGLNANGSPHHVLLSSSKANQCCSLTIWGCKWVPTLEKLPSGRHPPIVFRKPFQSSSLPLHSIFRVHIAAIWIIILQIRKTEGD